jgi:arylsulfatase A-like enzyme
MPAHFRAVQSLKMKQINLSFHLLTTLLLLLTLVEDVWAQKRNVTGQKHSKYNVLFLLIDDLRPELGCYGNKYIHSPNIDRFASTATVFKKHFVVVPTCGPSRACLLTGKRPRTVDELSNDVLQIKQEAGIVTKAPESFVDNLRLNGYYTVGIGKISHSPDGHIYNYTDKKGTQRELPRSWNEMLFNPGKWGTGWNAFFGYADGSNRNQLKGQVKPYESADVPDEGYPDGLTTSLAIEKLRQLATGNMPFFMGVGFFKPHLPFNAPAKYWNMYNEAQISLTPSPAIPENIHRASLQESAEFNNGYKLGDEKASLSKPLSDAYARKLRHGYYAGISYVDAQVGKVLETLKELGLEKNTIIVLWGDHGWHLGDDLVWGKHTLSEWSLRSPLIVKMPGAKKGSECNRIVSSIDIYPTLMELCGVEAPAGLDGKSFSVLLKDPARKDWNNVAYSYFKRGISIRTDSFRLTKYYRAEKPDIELYDHRTDDYENKNISLMHPEMIQQLQPMLENGNTGLYHTVPFKRARSTSGE